MIDKLIMYLNYPFVRYAFIVGVLVALCSSLFGVILVLKRFSFIGDGLSHVAFGAMTISTVLSIQNELPFVMLFTIIVAIIILNNKKIRGDAMVGMLSVGSLAIGYLLMNISGTSANVAGDVCSTLFGSTSILTLSISDVYLCVILSIVVIILFIGLYNKIFSITFDEDFAKAVGVNVEFYNLIFAIVIAIIIVLAMNLVGSLLIHPRKSNTSYVSSNHTKTLLLFFHHIFCKTTLNFFYLHSVFYYSKLHIKPQHSSYYMQL